MRKYLLSAICVLTIATVSLSAQKREEIKFIIDGNEVENFDGSQLTGHTVESYNIETVKEGNKLIKKHIILTEKSISVLKVRVDTIKVTHHDPVYVINGDRVVSKEEFNRFFARARRGPHGQGSLAERVQEQHLHTYGGSGESRLYRSVQKCESDSQEEIGLIIYKNFFILQLFRNSIHSTWPRKVEAGRPAELTRLALVYGSQA